MINRKPALLLAVAVASLAPAIALAYPGSIGLDGLLTGANNILIVVSVLFDVFAAIMFLFAGFLFLSANGNAQKVVQARWAVVWGSVGVLIGIGAPGIIAYIAGLVGA
jgi:hypothetical protein